MQGGKLICRIILNSTYSCAPVTVQSVPHLMPDTTLMHAKYRMRLVCAHMDYITVEINDVDKMIGTVPDVERNSAITIISETGTDLSQFSSSKCLCYWAGPAPGSTDALVKSREICSISQKHQNFFEKNVLTSRKWGSILVLEVSTQI